MKHRSTASFGKRQEYIAVAELLRRGFDVYMTLVDDQQIDCVVRQERTNTPLQALALLNDGFMLAQSRHFAERLERECTETNARINLAFRLTLGRLPAASEKKKLSKFIQTHGLPNFCRVLLNLNEFVFMD